MDNNGLDLDYISNLDGGIYSKIPKNTNGYFEISDTHKQLVSQNSDIAREENSKELQRLSTPNITVDNSYKGTDYSLMWDAYNRGSDLPIRDSFLSKMVEPNALQSIDYDFKLENAESYWSKKQIRDTFKDDRLAFDRFYKDIQKGLDYQKEQQFIETIPVVGIENMTPSEISTLRNTRTKSAIYNNDYKPSQGFNDFSKSLDKTLYDKGKIYDGTKLKKNKDGKVLSIDEADAKNALIKYSPDSWLDGLNLRVGYGGVIKDVDSKGNVFLRTLSEGEDVNGGNILGLAGIRGQSDDSYFGAFGETSQSVWNGFNMVLKGVPQLVQIGSHLINYYTNDNLTKGIYQGATAFTNRMDLLDFNINEGYEKSNIGYWGVGAGTAIGMVGGVYLTAGTGLLGVGSKATKMTANLLAGKNTAQMLNKALTMSPNFSANAGAVIMGAMSADEVAQTARLAGVKHWSTLAGLYMPVSIGLNMLPAHLLFGSGARKGFEKIGLLNLQKEQARILSSEMDRLTPLLKNAGEKEIGQYAVKLADNVYQGTLKALTNNKSYFAQAGSEGITEGLELLGQKAIYNMNNLYMNQMGYTKEKGYKHFTNKDLELNNKELFESVVFGSIGGFGGKAIANISQFGSLYDNSTEKEKSEILEYITNDKKYKAVTSLLEKQANGTSGKNLFYQQGIDINGKVITDKNTRTANQEVAQNILDNMILHKTTFDNFKKEVDKVLPSDLKNALSSFKQEDKGKVLADLFKVYDANTTLENADNNKILDFVKSDVFKKEAKQRLLAHLELPVIAETQGFYEYYSKNNNEILKTGFEANLKKAKEDLDKYNNIPVIDETNIKDIETSNSIFATKETKDKVDKYYENEKEKAISETDDKTKKVNEYYEEKTQELDDLLGEEEIDDVVYKERKEKLEKEKEEFSNKLNEILKNQLSSIDSNKEKSLSKIKEIKDVNDIFNITSDVFFNEEDNSKNSIDDKLDFFEKDNGLSMNTVNKFASDEFLHYIQRKQLQLNLIHSIGQKVNEGQKDSSIEAYSPTLTDDEYNKVINVIKGWEARINTLIKKAQENEKAFTKQNFVNEVELMRGKYEAMDLLKGLQDIDKTEFNDYVAKLDGIQNISEIETSDELYTFRLKAFEEYKQNELKVFESNKAKNLLSEFQNIYQEGKKNDKGQDTLNKLYYLFLLTTQNPTEIYTKISQNLTNDFYPSLEQIIGIRLSYAHLTIDATTEFPSLGDNISLSTFPDDAKTYLPYDVNFTPLNDKVEPVKEKLDILVESRDKQPFNSHIFIVEGFEGTGKTKMLSILNNMLDSKQVTYYAPKQEQLDNIKNKVSDKLTDNNLKLSRDISETNTQINIIDEYTLLRFEEWEKIVKNKGERYLLIGDEGQASIQQGLKEDSMGQPTMLIPRNTPMTLNQRSDFTVFRRINSDIRKKLVENKKNKDFTPITLNIESDKFSINNIGRKGIIGVTDKSQIPQEHLNNLTTITEVKSLQDVITLQGRELNKPYYINIQSVTGSNINSYMQSVYLKALLSAIGRASGDTPLIYINTNSPALNQLQIFFKPTDAPVLRIENKQSVRDKLKNNPLLKAENKPVKTPVDVLNEQLIPYGINVTKEEVNGIPQFTLEKGNDKKIISTLPTLFSNNTNNVTYTFENNFNPVMFYTSNNASKETIYTFLDENLNNTQVYTQIDANDNVTIQRGEQIIKSDIPTLRGNIDSVNSKRKKNKMNNKPDEIMSLDPKDFEEVMAECNPNP